MLRLSDGSSSSSSGIMVSFRSDLHSLIPSGLTSTIQHLPRVPSSQLAWKLAQVSHDYTDLETKRCLLHRTMWQAYASRRSEKKTVYCSAKYAQTHAMFLVTFTCVSGCRPRASSAKTFAASGVESLGAHRSSKAFGIPWLLDVRQFHEGENEHVSRLQGL